MAYSDSGLGAALDGVAGLGTYLSLHTDDPGTTGAGEDTGVPRQSATWNTPAGGASLAADQVTFPISGPGGGERTYRYFGIWTADADGTFVAGGGLDQTETFSDTGGSYNFTATLTAASAGA